MMVTALQCILNIYLCFAFFLRVALCCALRMEKTFNSELTGYRILRYQGKEICTVIVVKNLNNSLWIILTHFWIITKLHKQNIRQNKIRWIKLIVSKGADNQVQQFPFLCCGFTVTEIQFCAEIKDQYIIHSSFIQLHFYKTINLHSGSQWIRILLRITCDVLKRLASEWMFVSKYEAIFDVNTNRFVFNESAQRDIKTKN